MSGSNRFLPPAAPRDREHILAACHAWVNIWNWEPLGRVLPALTDLPGSTLVAARMAQEMHRKEVRMLLMRALAREPRDPLTLWLNVRLLCSRGEHEPALRLLEYLESHPPPGLEEQVLLSHGQVLAALNRPERAAERLQQAATLKTGSSLPWTLLGQVQLRQLSQPEAARKSLSRALELNPYDPDTLQLLAELERGSPAEVEALRRLVELQPDHAEHWVELARALQSTDPREARRAAREALRWDPDNADAKALR